MTEQQAVAEVFYTAFQALKKSEREAFLNKLLEDEKLVEDLRCATAIDRHRIEPTVSLDNWTKLNERLRTLQNKLDVVTSIQSGIKEMKEARKSKRKLQTLSDFINESRS